MDTLIQLTIDVLAYFLAPFAIVLAVNFVVSLFRYK